MKVRNKKIIKLVGIIMLVLFFVLFPLLLLQSCSALLRKWQNTPVKKEGLEIGFRYENSKGSLITAIKSDKTEFDIDNVTLDFYYGGNAAEYPLYKSVALYFMSEKVDRFYDFSNVDDYKNMDECFFIKELTIEKFNSGPFDIEKRWSPKQKDKKFELYFHYVDTLTVPKEMFQNQRGSVAFVLAYIALNEENMDEYRRVYIVSGQTISYSKTEQGTVVLEEG